MTPGDSNQAAASLRSGIVLIIAAMSLAAFTGALMKSLTDTMSPMLIGWFRFTGFFIIILPIALARVGRAAFRPPRIGIQVMRGVFQVAGNLTFMFGVMGLAFADAIAILYVYPFLMTLLAPSVLGERVSAAGWLGVFGGFAGVLLVVRPNPSGLDAHALFVLCTGLLVALQMLLNRKLGVLADSSVIAMWGALIASLLLVTTLPFVWTPVAPGDYGIIVLMAFTSAASQTMMILAMSRTPASDLAPFTYTEIVSAVLIGLVMFGTLPDALSWAGIGLITLSGVLVARAQGRISLRRQPKI
ncbi:MAG: DMT family transporter [Paracoccaceae bacterium]|nr:DMT family transporter [Paracoccaceae bacterium]